jgi:hypothetical protein
MECNSFGNTGCPLPACKGCDDEKVSESAILPGSITREENMDSKILHIGCVGGAVVAVWAAVMGGIELFTGPFLAASFVLAIMALAKK